MAMKRKLKRPHFGLINKKRLLVEGFVLLRRLAQGPLSRDEAQSELGIPYREWYRWLQIFAECDIPLAINYRMRHGKANEKTIRLWREDWNRLVANGTAQQKARADQETKRSRQEVEQIATRIQQSVKELRRLAKQGS